jgi:hypothetical protein
MCHPPIFGATGRRLNSIVRNSDKMRGPLRSIPRDELQRRQSTNSSASIALTQLRREQTSIALGVCGIIARIFPRGLLH